MSCPPQFGSTPAYQSGDSHRLRKAFLGSSSPSSVAEKPTTVPIFDDWWLSSCVWNRWKFTCTEARACHNRFKQLGLLRIDFERCLKYPEQLKQLRRELICPVVWANVVERRRFLASSFLHAVFEPR